MGQLARGLHRALAPAALVLLIGLTAWRSGQSAQWPPRSLRDAGLYTNFEKRQIAADYLPYSPQYPLWSDGAVTRRWIRLPAGKTVDVRNPNRWVFPVGTRIWKEFSIGGHPVETRLMEALSTGKWLFVTYAWAGDGTDAPLAPAAGLRHVVETGPGKGYDIPSSGDCLTCHGLHQPEVLGFSALQLSPDVDPGSLADAREPDDLDLAKLMATGRLRGAPAGWTKQPPRVAARGPQERAALGYVHGNCGGCHDSKDNLGILGLNLRHREGMAREPALAAVGQRSHYQIPGTPPGQTLHIRVGDPTYGSVVYRMGTRNRIAQMPPLGTNLPDERALTLMRAWIGAELPKNENPTAQRRP